MLIVHFANCFQNLCIVGFRAKLWDYLASVREKAIEAGISEALVNQEFFQLKPDLRVLELDKKQPEFVQTTEDYLKQRLSDKRISEGKRLLLINNELLAVERSYQVDANYIVAFGVGDKLRELSREILSHSLFGNAWS